MAARRRSWLIPSVVPLVALAACRDSSHGGDPSLLANVGISAVSMQGQGELWVLEVAESDEGGTDLNGDGDPDDRVAFVYDLADGSLTNLALDFGRSSAGRERGFPSPFVSVGDVLVAFGVSEADQGDTDLNADGDCDDVVLHVYDARSRLATNTQLAVAALKPAIGLASVAFAVSELAQGARDLDASGTAEGFVLHVYDARTRLATNAQRNVTSEISFHNHAFAFTTDEPSAHAILNADGEELDGAVLQLYDLVVGGIVNVPLAIRGRPLAVAMDDWFVLVDEFQQGAVLNGDFDSNDGVFHFVEPHLGTIQSLGLSSASTFQATTNGTVLAFDVQEIDAVDRNGDFDFDDSFVAVHDPTNDLTFASSLPMSTLTPLVFAGERLGFLVNELVADDRNGDLDFADDIVHTLNTVTGTVASLDLDALSLQGAGGRLLFLRSEDDDDLVGDDWNGDGDVDDTVVFVWDALTGATSNTQLASAGPVVAASSSALLLLGTESGQREDLNGDGDREDDAWVLHDLVSGANVNLGGAAVSSNAGLLEDGRGIVLVSEDAQGRDLNGDRDTDDLVLHTFQAP